MNLRIYFNFFLLALCLCTILITLITYIVFRLRYSLKEKSSKGLVNLDGQFFTRFAPHIDKKNREKLEINQRKTLKPLSFKMKIGYVMVLCFVFIFGGLVSEDLLVYRSELDKRAQSAETFRKLLDQGLLKKYSFEPKKVQPSEVEYIDKIFIQQLKLNALHLKDKTFILFSNEENIKNSNGHVLSMEKWEEFFKRYGLRYEIMTRVYNADKNATWILPNYARMLNREFEILEGQLQLNQKIIFTGEVGTYNLDTKSYQKNWFENNTELKIKENIDSNNSKPTQFSYNSPLLWNLPPGVVLNLAVNKPESIFLSESRDILGHETSFQGKNSKSEDLFHARLKLSKNAILWSHHDPLNIDLEEDKDLKAPLYYSDSLFLSSLSWAAKIDQARVEVWKNGNPLAVILSMDAEDKFENSEGLIKGLKKANLPVTVFAVSDLYKEKPLLLKNLTKIDELASHSNDHRVMPDFNSFDNFKRLEKSRLDLEQIHHQEIIGFRPPEERFGVDTLNAVIQNKFSYIFGDQRIFRFSPIFIANGDLLFYPRVVNDDFSILNNPLLVTPEQVAGEMIKDLNHVEQFGGAYFFSMHTQIFGDKKYYKQALELFYKHLKTKKVWVTTFRDMTNWWKNREQLLVNHDRDARGHLNLTVYNKGKFSVEGVTVKTATNHSNRHLASADDEKNYIHFPQILPGEKVTITLK